MEDKIIQITQAPDNLWVRCRFIDYDDGGREGYCLERIVCFALVEDYDGCRSVKSMIMGDDGYAMFADSVDTYGTAGDWKPDGPDEDPKL